MGIVALDDLSVRRVLYEAVAPLQQRCNQNGKRMKKWWNNGGIDVDLKLWLVDVLVDVFLVLDVCFWPCCCF